MAVGANRARLPPPPSHRLPAPARPPPGPRPCLSVRPSAFAPPAPPKCRWAAGLGPPARTWGAPSRRSPRCPPPGPKPRLRTAWPRGLGPPRGGGRRRTWETPGGWRGWRVTAGHSRHRRPRQQGPLPRTSTGTAPGPTEGLLLLLTLSPSLSLTRSVSLTPASSASLSPSRYPGPAGHRSHRGGPGLQLVPFCGPGPLLWGGGRPSGDMTGAGQGAAVPGHRVGPPCGHVATAGASRQAVLLQPAPPAPPDRQGNRGLARCGGSVGPPRDGSQAPTCSTPARPWGPLPCSQHWLFMFIYLFIYLFIYYSSISVPNF